MRGIGTLFAFVLALVLAGGHAHGGTAKGPACPPETSEVVESVEAERELALTFDEPLGAQTRPILRALDRYGMSATFFLVGSEVEEKPGLARAILRKGHELGNHTFEHEDLGGDDARPGKTMRQNQHVIRRTTGVTPCFFRPPYGSMSDRVVPAANRQGMSVVKWSLAATEWYFTSDRIVDHITTNIEPGDIVLFHQVESSREALPEILEHIEGRGWEATTTSDLLAGEGE